MPARSTIVNPNAGVVKKVARSVERVERLDDLENPDTCGGVGGVAQILDEDRRLRLLGYIGQSQPGQAVQTPATSSAAIFNPSWTPARNSSTRLGSLAMPRSPAVKSPTGKLNGLARGRLRRSSRAMALLCATVRGTRTRLPGNRPPWHVRSVPGMDAP